MKKIIALFLFSFFASNAWAEQIPDGCYVALNNPRFCYASPTGFYEWTSFGDQSNSNAKYGFAVGAILGEGRTVTAARDSYLAQLNDALTERNSITPQFNTCIADYNKLVTPYNKNLSLIKKLRKACGTKCKKIK